jgi:predicted nucleic acid-binding protein
MPRKILDTSVLIAVWRKRCAEAKSPVTEVIAATWGEKLRDFYPSAFLVSPVILEVLSGSRTAEELQLSRAFLSPFENLDKGEIPVADWEQARRFAERIPKDGKPRQLGDCIIAAIARRLRCEVITFDK